MIMNSNILMSAGRYWHARLAHSEPDAIWKIVTPVTGLCEVTHYSTEDCNDCLEITSIREAVLKQTKRGASTDPHYT